MTLTPESCILYQDDDILAAAKPAGYETYSETGGRFCFSSFMRRGLRIDALAPVHRLDRDTTGVQLFACHKRIKRPLEKCFRDHLVRKQYLAICLGVPHCPAGSITQKLSRWTSGHRPVRSESGKRGLAAETAYQVIRFDAAHSLILFMPQQGRTHQIRVHAESLGQPILGDDQYGKRAANRLAKQETGLARQALHAWRLAFLHPKTSARIEIEAPLPDDLRVAITHYFPDAKTALAAIPFPPLPIQKGRA